MDSNQPHDGPTDTVNNLISRDNWRLDFIEKKNKFVHLPEASKAILYIMEM